MTEDTHRALSSLRKKRGVARASVTRLLTKLTELESATRPDTLTAPKCTVASSV